MMTLNSTPRFCIGVDIADRTFVATILNSQSRLTNTVPPFEQSPDGVRAFVRWLHSHHAYRRSTAIAMETTGVFGQRLCIHLRTEGYGVSVIDAARIAGERRRSQPNSDRHDRYDIADYLSRHWDEVPRWAPREPVLMECDALLGMREHVVKMRTQSQNRKKALGRGLTPHPGVIAMLQQPIEYVTGNSKDIERQLKQTLQEHAPLERAKELLDSIPRVSSWLSISRLRKLLQLAQAPAVSASSCS